MASSRELRSWWAAYKCAPEKMVRVAFPGDGRVWNLLVAAEAKPLWEVFAGIMVKHDYLFRESAGGTYNCRKISGTNVYSLHSYGTALDLNPSKNPYKQPLTHDYPAAFIAEVLAHKTNGKQSFRWGGAWSRPDAMHWEINVAPSDIDQTEPPPGDDDVEQVYKDLQEGLKAAGYYDGTIDGLWGPKSKAAYEAMCTDAASGGAHSHPEYLTDVKGVKA